jgi:lysophospholipase L1-like esterase
MDKLWTFGDSFTAGHGCTPEWEYYKKYYKEGDGLWSHYLANELNLELVNLGKNGASNDQIIDSIIVNYNKISINDTVIIQKSFPSRFDVPSMIAEGDEWISIFPRVKSDLYLKTLSKEQYETVIDFYYHFADNSKYKKRQNLRFSFLINCLIKDGIKVYLWDILKENGKYETIQSATNGEIDDGHFSFKGHNQFYKSFLKKTKNEII